MDASAIASTLIEKFGKKWYFLTPTMPTDIRCRPASRKSSKPRAHVRRLACAAGHAGLFVLLIQAKTYGPQVLINVMGGGDQVSSLKQFVQFGLDKQMAVGGALFELESIRAVPDGARVGWWTMEWWWDQPGVPHVRNFNAAIKKITGSAATARKLVWLRIRADAGADCEPGEDARRSEARACAVRLQAAAGSRVAAGLAVIPRRRPTS